MSVRKITTIALIASIYAVVTWAVAPLSYGPIQLRISEILTVLPFITPLAVPGIFIGVVVANLLSPVGIFDIIFGSLASLLAAWLTAKMPPSLASTSSTGDHQCSDHRDPLGNSR